MKTYEVFTKWHQIKSQLEKQRAPFFREQEIWWCSLGCNLGTEQDGKNESFERPVLIIRKFNADLFWGLPLTSQPKFGKFYVPFLMHQKSRTAILSQLRVLSGKRLTRRIAKISDPQFERIGKTLADFYKKTDPLLRSKESSGA